MGFFSSKRDAGYEKLLAEERAKARASALKSRAKAEGMRQGMKDADAISFAALPRIERAKARLKGAGNFLSKTRGVIGNIDKKFSQAEKRFNQKADEFNGQNSNVLGGKGGVSGGLLGESIRKSK